MKNSLSVKIVKSPTKILSIAAQKQLNYFDPKGASKRILPFHLKPNTLDNSPNNKSSESLSPTKLPPIRRLRNDHSALVRSTRTIKQLNLISSRESSPTKIESNTGETVGQISGIIESCEIISKINKSDMVLANRLKKSNIETFEITEEGAGIRKTELGIKLSNKRNSKKGPGQASIDQIKRESFETAYYIEKNLNKNNSVKKLKEKIMPWKKVAINN